MIFGRDIGIDLGTANVVVSAMGRGVIAREPSVVAMDRNTGYLLKVGAAAQRMLGRTPGNIVALHPVSGGVISDFDMTERMIRELIRKAVSFSLIRPRLLISVPSGITEVEERAVLDCGIRAGARKVYLMEEPVAAALGAGIDISGADGKMVVDIGAGTTDVAVLSLSGVVRSASIKTAGNAYNEALIRYIRRKHNLLIGDTTAEEIKKSIGCVFPKPEETSVEVKGRSLMTGLPQAVSVSTADMIEAFDEVSRQILDMIHSVLETTPPELVADISGNGIVLTGGGALLWGMDKLIEGSTSITTRIADDAETCVASGIAKSLRYIGDMEEGTLNLERKRRLRE